MVGTTSRVLSGVATTSALVVAGAASSDAAPSDTTLAVVQRLAERQKELDAVSAAAQRKVEQIDSEDRTKRNPHNGMGSRSARRRSSSRRAWPTCTRSCRSSRTSGGS